MSKLMTKDMVIGECYENRNSDDDFTAPFKLLRLHQVSPTRYKIDVEYVSDGSKDSFTPMWDTEWVCLRETASVAVETKDLQVGKYYIPVGANAEGSTVYVTNITDGVVKARSTEGGPEYNLKHNMLWSETTSTKDMNRYLTEQLKIGRYYLPHGVVDKSITVCITRIVNGTVKAMIVNDHVEHDLESNTLWCETCKPDHSEHTPTPITRSSVLDEAKDMITGDRAAMYGDPKDNFSHIASVWSVRLGIELKPADIALMMIDLKLARAWHDPSNKDNWVDIAGYAACGGEVSDVT